MIDECAFIADIQELSEALLMKGEHITRDSTLLHRLVELKRELMLVAEFLEQERVKRAQSG